jgi:hypothetical protein
LSCLRKEHDIHGQSRLGNNLLAVPWTSPLQGRCPLENRFAGPLSQASKYQFSKICQ